jgi:hypothetical protein
VIDSEIDQDQICGRHWAAHGLAAPVISAAEHARHRPSAAGTRLRAKMSAEDLLAGSSISTALGEA